MPDNIVEFEDEPIEFGLEIKKEKENVNAYDVFRLAKGILIVAVIIYVLFALVRIFCNDEGSKEVWEYTKVVLNSIVSLVLGLYFGTKQEAKKD